MSKHPSTPIKDKLRSVIDHGNKEIQYHTRFRAVGRFDYLMNNEMKYVWIYSSLDPGPPLLNIQHGQVVHAEQINSDPYTVEPFVMSKNSPLMRSILTQDDPFSPFVFRDRQFELSFSVEYRRKSHSQLFDTKNGRIVEKMKWDEEFTSIVDYWKYLPESDASDDDQLLAEELRRRRESQSDSKSTRLRLIRDGNDLRMKHILDPVQNRIKFRDLDSGPFILEGGPGSGKTTTLIQRFKYITDPYLERDPEYPSTLKERLQSGKAWLFFSPSETLLSYLKKAISEEGLVSSPASTTHLKHFIQNYSRETGLVQPGNDAAYKTASYKGRMDISLKDIDTWFSAYESHLVELLRKRVRIAKEKYALFGASFPSIQAHLSRLEQIESQSGLVRILQNLNSLQESASFSIKDEQEQLKQKLNLESSRLLIKFRSEGLLGELQALLSSQVPNALDETDEELENGVDSDLEIDDELRIQSKLSTWIRLVSLRHVENQPLPSGRQRDWLNRVNFAMTDETKQELGLLAGYLNTFGFFKRSLNQHLKLIYDQYKVFRSKVGVNLFPNSSWRAFWEQTPKNPTSIHSSEMLLLLLYGNHICRSLKKSLPSVFRETDSFLVSAYRNWERVMVGIDEASDFTPLEIRFMMSFADEKYNCVTLVGDIMQRLQSHGLSSWEEIDGLVPKKVSLEVSYRQSSKLLSLADHLHRQATGRPMALKSHYNDPTHEPNPWLTKKETPNDVGIWIADKIKDIYNDYNGALPSIAIFAPNNQTVRVLSETLSEVPFFEENNFELRACTTDQPAINSTGITVYNIELIKGMEFDAAFFVDIDNIEVDDHLLLKYLYVGISRAAFFFGLTYKERIPPVLDHVFNTALFTVDP